MKLFSLALFLSVFTGTVQAETLTLVPTEITEWKAVQARVESRDIVLKRGRGSAASSKNSPSARAIW